MNNITWDLKAETIQTIMSHLTPGVRAYVLEEMRDQDPEQYLVALAIHESDHLQDSW